MITRDDQLSSCFVAAGRELRQADCSEEHSRGEQCGFGDLIREDWRSLSRELVNEILQERWHRVQAQLLRALSDYHSVFFGSLKLSYDEAAFQLQSAAINHERVWRIGHWVNGWKPPEDREQWFGPATEIFWLTAGIESRLQQSGIPLNNPRTAVDDLHALLNPLFAYLEWLELDDDRAPFIDSAELAGQVTGGQP